MEEYKSNSHKSRQNQNDDIPEKRVEKVVSGSVKSKKKNGLQKITNVFVPEALGVSSSENPEIAPVVATTN